MTFLIVDGSDKVGKDTLIAAFHKATGYKYSAINRWGATSFAYGKFWNRDLDFKGYLAQDLNNINDALLVYLYAPLEVLEQRFKKHDEKDMDLKELDRLRTHYEEFLNNTPLKVVRIDTSKPIDFCIKQITDAIYEFENECVLYKVLRLINYVNKNGQDILSAIPAQLTKEVRNVTLKYKDSNLDDLQKSINMTSYLQEFQEYETIYHVLANEIRLKSEYFKNQDMSSRQFIYSGTSCISNFHVMCRNDTLEVNVYIRSSNLYAMLLNDIYGIDYIARKINDRFFTATRIKYNVHIGSAHIIQ